MAVPETVPKPIVRRTAARKLIETGMTPGQASEQLNTGRAAAVSCRGRLFRSRGGDTGIHGLRHGLGFRSLNDRATRAPVWPQHAGKETKGRTATEGGSHHMAKSLHTGTSVEC